MHARRYLLTLLGCVTPGRWRKWSLTEIFRAEMPARCVWRLDVHWGGESEPQQLQTVKQGKQRPKIQPKRLEEATKKCRFTTHMVTIITLLCLLTAAVTFPNTSSIMGLARVPSRFFPVCSETAAPNRS